MEVTNRLSFNGVDLRNYGLYVSGDKTFNSPTADYTRFSIPGRSGDIFAFNNRYGNVTVDYDSILIRDYAENAAQLRSILLSPTNYCRIEDDYNPDEYRMGIFIGPLNFDTLFLEAGTTTLSFDCQPQRWLKSGENEININAASTTINNPTKFNSKPLIKIVGRGNYTFTFTYSDSTTSEFTFKIPAANDGTYYIDCESMDCYKDPADTTVYPNSFITVDEFPVLKPGNTTIAITKPSTTVREIKLTPRWYIL